MQTAHTFEDLLSQIRVRLVPFMAVFFAVVFFTYLVLYILDFYPEPKTETEEQAASALVVEEVEDETIKPVVAPLVVAQTPLLISFDKLDRDVKILNPESESFEVLDQALLSGVVRHPQSAYLGENGNVFILGHSSYLPNVMNKNFQAFNGIEKLTWGDIVRIESNDKEYIYRVDRVYKAKASEIVVPTEVTGSKLTLATCNVFGAKEDRFMLEATLIETNLL